MKKVKAKPTVTVAISALNEQDNIIDWLKSVTKQKEKNFVLEKIIIHSDGSTDNTVKLAKSIRDSRIKIIDHKKRMGKSFRLNQIYKDLETEFLVQSDADVVFAHELVISDLIHSFLGNQNIMMCGGNSVPVGFKTFVEKALKCSFIIYANQRDKVRNGNNLFSVDGKLVAYRKKFCKEIFIPSNMIGNDVYTYFECISRGYLYRFTKKAIVYFRFPQNLKDNIKQATRFAATPLRLQKYFDKNLVAKEYSVPRLFRLKNLMLIFLKHPILASYVYFMNKYCNLLAKKVEKEMHGKWEIAKTTKMLSSVI